MGFLLSLPAALKWSKRLLTSSSEYPWLKTQSLPARRSLGAAKPWFSALLGRQVASLSVLVSLQIHFHPERPKGADLGKLKKKAWAQPSVYYTESKSHILGKNKVHLVFWWLKKKILYPEHFNIHLNIKESNRGVSHFKNQSLDSNKGSYQRWSFLL